MSFLIGKCYIVVGRRNVKLVNSNYGTNLFSPHTCSRSDWQRSLNTDENCIDMEQEVESRAPVSILYRHRVGEVGQNAKRQGGGNSTLSISILK